MLYVSLFICRFLMFRQWSCGATLFFHRSYKHLMHKSHLTDLMPDSSGVYVKLKTSLITIWLAFSRQNKSFPLRLGGWHVSWQTKKTFTIFSNISDKI